MTLKRYATVFITKNGDRVLSKKIFQGEPQPYGKVVEFELITGAIVKGRIGSTHTSASEQGGNPTDEVDVKEI
jgi:hypothetical protein